ncbi:response regulator [Providencia hangzhouensis]
MRILLVEDHDELSLWLQKALSSSGFAVDIASDGAIADQLLQTEQYALVVLDVSLPRMSGSGSIGANAKTSSRDPCFAVDGNGNVADRVQGLNAGADDYLTKPFDIAVRA